MNRLWVSLFAVMVVGCSSPDDKAGKLLGEARTLLAESKSFADAAREVTKSTEKSGFGLIVTPTDTPEAKQAAEKYDDCVTKASEAKSQMDKLYQDFPGSAPANSLETRMLQGEIQLAISNCMQSARRMRG